MEQEHINGIPLLTVTALSRVVEKSITGIYPSGIWIEGEIAELKARPHISGHYFSLIDGLDEQRRALPMCLWKKSGSLDRVMAKMSQLGVPLENGMRVRFLCKLNFYKQKGEFSLNVTDVDPQYTLGNIAVKRDQLIAKIMAKGLDKVNKEIRVPSMPLSLGVVSSAQADGWQDALKQFRDSKFAFRLVFCASAVQGFDAPEQLVAAIRTLDRRDDIDVILLVRGGGSKTDLAAFDDERVAMAIVSCRHAVFTGIGHTPDTSIADIVAHTQCKTPTAAAEEIILKVRRFRNHLDSRAQVVLDSSRRSISHSRNRTNRYSELLVVKSRSRLAMAREKNYRLGDRVKTRPVHIFQKERTKIENMSVTVRLLDPVTTLAKGWSLTRNVDGVLIRSAHQLKNGDVIVTSFVDGLVNSEVKGES